MLTVIKRDGYISKNKIAWLCHCDCGNYKRIAGSSLRRGYTKSCGCHSGKKYYDIKEDENISVNNYDLTGEYGIGYTSSGQTFKFDIEDYKLIKNYSWHLSDCGYVASTINGIKTTKLLMHRLVMDVSDSTQFIDHINHDKTDNRKQNLRICTCSQNQMNKRIKPGNSGHRGVSWHKNKKRWFAHICVDGRLIHLGAFENIDEAIIARKEAEKKYFGEFSYNEKLDAINVAE